MPDNDTFIVDFSFTSAAVAGTSLITPTGKATETNIQVPLNPQTVDPRFVSCLVCADLQGGTGGVLDIYLQVSPDKGVNWFDKVHFPQKADGASAVLYIFSLSKYDTPVLAPIVTGGQIGAGSNTPALAANTIVPGNWGDRWRLVQVAGAGMSAGKAQILKMIFTR